MQFNDACDMEGIFSKIYLSNEYYLMMMPFRKVNIPSTFMLAKNKWLTSQGGTCQLCLVGMLGDFYLYI
jgi:hypothetical protein